MRIAEASTALCTSLARSRPSEGVERIPGCLDSCRVSLRSISGTFNDAGATVVALGDRLKKSFTSCKHPVREQVMYFSELKNSNTVLNTKHEWHAPPVTTLPPPVALYPSALRYSSAFTECNSTVQ